MAARSGIGLATVITAVTLAVSGPSGAEAVGRDGSVTVSSAVVVQVGGSGRPSAAVEGFWPPPDVVEVLGDLLAGLPTLPGRLARAIPARVGPRLFLMHF
jgi:hypothetical protein